MTVLLTPPTISGSMVITEHKLFKCPLCSRFLCPTVCDDFRKNDINYERIWWVCEGAESGSCHFPLGLQIEIFMTKRDYGMRDSGVWPMPNFHLLPKEYHIYYLDYFDSDGNFNFDKIREENFGDLIKIPESYLYPNEGGPITNEFSMDIRNSEVLEDPTIEVFQDGSLVSDVMIEGNIYTQSTDVKVQAAIAINKNLPKFCDQIKDDSINSLKKSRPYAVKKLSKRQLQDIKKHIVKKRKLCNENCKKWNEMTLDEQEAYLEEHAFSIHSSISSNSSRASSSRTSSTRTGLSSQSSSSSRNISVPHSPRMVSPIEYCQSNDMETQVPRKTKNDMIPMFDDPVLNDLLNDSLAVAMTESKEIVNKSKAENIQVPTNITNRLDLPMDEQTFQENTYTSYGNDDMRPDLSLSQNIDTTPNHDLLSLDDVEDIPLDLDSDLFF
uniref:THAP-type domain-containing protein n=1 Tax=Strongyloides papillosus TaxID=174720 RepID=A0A0N5BSQ8_STREA